MGISISTLEETAVLQVVYSSERVTDEALAAQRELVAKEVARTGINRVLLDTTLLESFPPILTSLRHNESVAGNELLRCSRFAVLCSSLGKDELALETTGVNRGVNMKCFTSREEALEWLT